MGKGQYLGSPIHAHSASGPAIELGLGISLHGNVIRFVHVGENAGGLLASIGEVGWLILVGMLGWGAGFGGAELLVCG